MGIEQRMSSGYRPSTQAITERFNGILSDMLSHFVSEKQTDWDLYLQPAVFSYNTTKQETIRMSPYECIFGRRAVIPPDVELQVKNLGINNSTIYGYNLAKYLTEAQKIVKTRLEKGNQRDIKYYNPKRTDVSFNIGEEVLLFDPFIIGGHLNKLSKRFTGPYTILEQKSPLKVHVWRMKRYFDRKDFIEKFENSFVDKSAQLIDIDAKSFQKFDLNNKLKSKSIDQNFKKSISDKKNNSHYKNLNRKLNKLI
jgi:hypothetical protein